MSTAIYLSHKESKAMCQALGVPHVHPQLEYTETRRTGQLLITIEQAKKNLAVAHARQLGRPHTQARKDHIGLGNSKEWTIIWPDGHEEDIRNMNDFCRKNNLDVGNMVRVANEVQGFNSHKGFKAKKKGP